MWQLVEPYLHQDSPIAKGGIDVLDDREFYPLREDVVADFDVSSHVEPVLPARSGRETQGGRTVTWVPLFNGVAVSLEANGSGVPTFRADTPDEGLQATRAVLDPHVFRFAQSKHEAAHRPAPDRSRSGPGLSGRGSRHDSQSGVQIVPPSVDSVGVRDRIGTSGMLGFGPVRPLMAFLAVAFGATAVETDGTDWSLVGVAATLAVALLAVTRMISWRQLSETYLMLPAIGTLVLIAILRQSQGGATSGYGPLAILPVVWVALTLGRRAVLVMATATTLMFALPIVLVGAPLYPASGWRSPALWMVVATVVGLVVASVVAQQRAHAATAEQQSVALAETLAALEAVAAVARDVSSGVDARELVCAAAASCTNASLVTLIERRDGQFVITGSAGLPVGLAELQSSVQPVASLSAFFSKSQVFISDVSTNAGVSPVLVEKMGLESILYEPIMRHGAPVGVLSIGWSAHLEQVDAKTHAVIRIPGRRSGSCD